MTYVILGSGAAGMAAAEKLRELDNEAQIIVASKEENPYHRMYLPDLLAGSMKKERIFSGAISLYKKKSITFTSGFTAVSIDIKSKKVYSKNNESLNYDKLLVAIGTQALIPDIFVSSGFRYILPDSLETIEKLKEEIIPLEKAAVIGAGLLGIQIVASLLKNGLSVSLIEKEDRILKNIMTKEQSDTLIRLLIKNGAEVYTASETVDVKERVLVLKNSKEVWFDHLFLTCGAVNSISISIPDLEISSDIFFAGACARSHSFLQASEQGMKVAYEMCGGQPQAGADSYPVILRDIELAYMGDFNTLKEAQKIIVRQKTEYKKLVIEDGLLTGFIFIGDSKKARLACSYITDKKPVMDADLRELLG